MMTPLLSFVYPYYCNPEMLAEHYRIWSAYSSITVKPLIEILLVDDGSPAPEEAFRVPRPDGLPTLRIYRVLEDRPWHQHAARNLGAREASGAWLFLSDIDHLVSPCAAAAMLQCCNYDVVNTFGRVDAPDLRPTRKNGRPHPHPNTFLMTKDRYWQIGGYDEDLTGYGTDAFFRARVATCGVPVVSRGDIQVIRFPREVIPDASTRTLPRKEGRTIDHRSKLRALAHRKAIEGRLPTVLAFPWERVL